MSAIIDIDAVSKTFGRSRALDGLSLRVDAGEVHGFLGPNGAGKTTTIRILLGMLRADSGRASVFGMDPWRDGPRVRARLAYVPGDVTLWSGLSGGEAIDVLCRLHGSRRDPGPWLERFELDPGRKCREYSKGNRQKVALVAAFTVAPELLVLDEPTSGLDPLMERVFTGAVREFQDGGGTVLLSSHLLTEVESLCDTVSIVRAGRRVDSGRPADLAGAQDVQLCAELARPETFTATVGTVLERSGSRLRLTVPPADLNAALTALTAAGVLSLSAAPPSLEETFLARYAGPAQLPAAVR